MNIFHSYLKVKKVLVVINVFSFPPDTFKNLILQYICVVFTELCNRF